MEKLMAQRIRESILVKSRILESREIMEMIDEISNVMTACLKGGGKLVICGNGGSASDALHFVGEIVGRFQRERAPWPALALNADMTTLTAIANDYSYEEAFARQTRGLVSKEDIFVGISTSGNSVNIINAARCAKAIGAKTVGFLGRDGGILKNEVDYPIIVPSDVTARIQESHILLIHILCELIEDKMEGCGEEK